MTYLSDKRRARSKYKYYIAIVIIAIVISYAWPTIHKIVNPYTQPAAEKYGVAKSTSESMYSNFVTFFSSKFVLQKENRDLEILVEQLENKLALKEAELRQANTLADASIASSTRVIVMYPLVQDVTSMYSTILLSKGFKDGVTKDALVYLRGRQPVCTIEEVYTSTSLCKLLSAYGETVDGVYGEMTLFLKGDGGGSFVADVLRDSSIKEGDPIYLKQDQTMVVGYVVSIVRDNQAAFWKVYVRGAYNPASSHIFYSNQ